MGELFDGMLAVFERAGWPVKRAENVPAVSLTYQGTNGEFVFIATVDEDKHILSVFSRAAFPCPAERRVQMAELLIRLNYGMQYGCFDMDFADGELRYRTGFDLANVELTDAWLLAVSRYNIASMDHWLPALQAVADGKASPAEAAGDAP